MMENKAFLSFCCLATAVGLAWGIFVTFSAGSNAPWGFFGYFTPGELAIMFSVIYLFAVVLMPAFSCTVFPPLMQKKTLSTRCSFS